jgi:hypothetical protein
MHHTLSARSVTYNHLLLLLLQLGHNMVWSAWKLANTGETINNIYTVYAMVSGDAQRCQLHAYCLFFLKLYVALPWAAVQLYCLFQPFCVCRNCCSRGIACCVLHSITPLPQKEEHPIPTMYSMLLILTGEGHGSAQDVPCCSDK